MYLPVFIGVFIWSKHRASPWSRLPATWAYHYTDVIMTTMASQITSLMVAYSTVYSDADQRKHQSSASLAFMWGIHRDRWIPCTKGQLRGKCYHLMTSSCIRNKMYIEICPEYPTHTKKYLTLHNEKNRDLLEKRVLYWNLKLAISFFCPESAIRGRFSNLSTSGMCAFWSGVVGPGFSLWICLFNLMRCSWIKMFLFF